MQRLNEEIQILVVYSSFAYKVRSVNVDIRKSMSKSMLTSEVVLQSNGKAGQIP